MTWIMVCTAVWLAVAWLAYRRERRAHLFLLLVERAYAEGQRRRAADAIERERLKRYNLEKFNGA